MSDYMTKSLETFTKEILADGVIDKEEVRKIRERIFADGIIDKQEADFLMKLNKATSGKNNDPGWKVLFIEAVTKFVLEDEVSPLVVDERECKWLISSLENSNTYVTHSLDLLKNIQSKAKSIPAELTALIKKLS